MPIPLRAAPSTAVHAWTQRNRGACKLLRPVLNAVINSQDFDALLLDAIDSDIGQGREQKLPGSFLPSDTATIRPVLQQLDGSVQFAQGRLPVIWLVVFEVVANVL